MKKILIAGASSGIGKSLAASLIARGDQIVSISRNHPDPDPGKLEHISHDFCGQEELPALDYPLDGLVYCPGSIQLKPFKQLKWQDFQRDWEINFLGAVKIIRHYLSNLLAGTHPSVVLFSSVAAGTGMPYHTSVSAAKGAIEGFTRSLAAELAPKLRVNAIAPSLVPTPLAARLTDTEAKIAAAAQRHPLQRIGEPQDIASLAAFLLSHEASWITGQILHVDGGMSTIKI